MNSETIPATVARLLTPAERQHWELAWLSTVDHKRIGILYMVTGLVFFVVAGLEALVIRLQLAVPNNSLVSPDTYNWLFTMHGTTMIFLVAMPVLFGIMAIIFCRYKSARETWRSRGSMHSVSGSCRSEGSFCISVSSQAVRRRSAGSRTRR